MSWLSKYGCCMIFRSCMSMLFMFALDAAALLFLVDVACSDWVRLMRTLTFLPAPTISLMNDTSC